jgi:endo-1,4-beta-xylanase
VITRSLGNGLVSALTFDDGPNGATTGRLLDFLAAHRIRAVFCLLGESVRAPGGAALVRRMADEGHVLCNHSTGHADMGDWDDPAIEADIVLNLQIIREALRDDGYPIPYFRAPYGNWGRTADVAARLGMRSLAVRNTIDDWRTQNPPELVANLRAAMKPGELVLAHDGGGDREATVDAVIAVVSERLAKGWRFRLPVTE